MDIFERAGIDAGYVILGLLAVDLILIILFFNLTFHTVTNFAAFFPCLLIYLPSSRIIFPRFYILK